MTLSSHNHKTPEQPQNTQPYYMYVHDVELRLHMKQQPFATAPTQHYMAYPVIKQPQKKKQQSSCGIASQESPILKEFPQQ